MSRRIEFLHVATRAASYPRIPDKKQSICTYVRISSSLISLAVKHCTFPLRTSSTIERIEHEPCYERTIEDRLIGRGARAFRQYPECSRERGRLEFIIDSSSFPSKVESFRAISKIFENDAREARRNKLSIERYYEYSRK